MTEVPPFLFMLTSTALVLGAAITVRGLLGFRPVASSATLPSPLAEGEPSDALMAQATGPHAAAAVEAAAGDATSRDGASSDASSPQAAATGVRDLREPFMMTIAGVFICIFTLLAIAALIHSA